MMLLKLMQMDFAVKKNATKIVNTLTATLFMQIANTKLKMCRTKDVPKQVFTTVCNARQNFTRWWMEPSVEDVMWDKGEVYINGDRRFRCSSV